MTATAPASSSPNIVLRDTDIPDCGYSPSQVAAILAPYYARADRLFAGLIGVHAAVAVALAGIYGTWAAAFGVGTAAAALYYLTQWLRPASFASRAAFGVAAQVFVALFTYQMQGLQEVRLFYFTAFAVMVAGFDWKAMLPGAALIVVQYFLSADSATSETAAFRFGIAALHVGLCGVLAARFRRQALLNAAQLERLEAAEAASRSKESRLRQVTDKMPGAAYRCLMSPDYRYSYPYVSRGVLDLLRLNPAEFLDGRDPIIERVVSDDRAGLETSLREAFVRGPKARWWREFRVNVDGVGVRWIRAEAVAAAAEDGCLLWTGLFVDVTDARRAQEERRSLETALVEGQRLESLGVMAEGLAHEFNNLLTVIQGHMALAGELDGAAAEILEPAVQASRKAADLCQQLQAYTGHGPAEPTLLHLNTLVAESAELLRCGVPHDARFLLHLGGDVPPVRGDTIGLRQLLINLVSNSGEAVVGRSGTITVRTGRVGPAAWLEVADTGVGMAPEIAERMFDPFFSTKFVGRGMGLAAVHGIAAGHGAKIAVDTEPGRGTTVRVEFREYVAAVDRNTPPNVDVGETVRISTRDAVSARPSLAP